MERSDRHLRSGCVISRTERPFEYQLNVFNEDDEKGIFELMPPFINCPQTLERHTQSPILYSSHAITDHRITASLGGEVILRDICSNMTTRYVMAPSREVDPRD